MAGAGIVFLRFIIGAVIAVRLAPLFAWPVPSA
jgi:hypothetical protein